MGIKCPRNDGTNPHCNRESLNIRGFKMHMTRQHGGYTEDEITAALSQLEPSSETQADFASIEPFFPERTQGDAPARDSVPRERTSDTRKPRQSSQSKALNQKLNECIDLTVKHLMGTIEDEEKKVLATKRGEITMAAFGANFNFDEKIVSFESKWMLMVMVALLYLLPNMPTAKTMFAMVREKQRKDAEKKAEATNGTSHP